MAQRVQAALSQPFLWVNKFGQRFYNEGNGRYWNDNHNAMTANGGVMFSIFDENMKTNLLRRTSSLTSIKLSSVENP